MYLHLGSETVVRISEITGIFDLENTSVSKLTRDFLAKAQKSGMVVNVSEELPKSFVVCSSKKNGARVYISQISPATLKKRASSVSRHRA